MKLAEDLTLIVEAIDEVFGVGYSKAKPSLVGACLQALVLEKQLSKLTFNLAECGDNLACSLSEVSPLPVRVVFDKANGKGDGQ